jgi:signal transduction histidine kinase/CheY-like chemotaxis protein
MEERFHTSLILADSPPLLPVLLTYRLYQAVPVRERDGVAFISFLDEQLHGLQKRAEGYYDIGLTTEQNPAIVVRMIALEPGTWDPSAGTEDIPAPIEAEVVDDQLLELSLPVEPEEHDLSSETVKKGRLAVEGLVERWREADEKDERVLEAVKQSDSAPSELERTVAGLLDELDRRTELYQELRKTRSAEHDRPSDDDEQSFLFRHLRHDLPAPLHTIDSTLDRLLETDLSDEQSQHVETLRQTSERVAQLVTDAVDLSRIKAGSIAIFGEPVHVRDFMEECLSVYDDRDRETVDLRYNVSQQVPTGVRFDTDRVRQVLVHVVDNALEHTSDGEVLIRVDTEGGEQDDLHLVWEVEDTGVGIPEHEQEHIFEAFYQSDASRNREGTGLGLTIVDRLVDAMDGWMDLRSTPGEGTVFRFGIPVDTDPAEDGNDADAGGDVSTGSISLEGKRVLVATDDTSTLNTMRRILESLDAEVSTVDNVVEVNDHFQLFPEEKPEFDAIFLNPHMSGLNGFELLETVHRNRSMEHVVPIASSAFEKKNRHYAASYGIQYFLSRPVDRQDLLEVVNALFDLDKGSGACDEQQSTSDWFAALASPIRLLLAEDNDLNRQFLCQLLEPHPIDITTATSGRDALEVYRENGGSIDMVFMDLKMPDMNGLEATKAIRELEEDESRSYTPIVALTAETMEERLEKSLEAGCDAHVSKPVDADRVMETIRDQLEGG